MVRVLLSDVAGQARGELSLTGSVRELLAAVSTLAALPRDQLVLMFNGRVLKEGTAIEAYGIQDGCTVFYTRRQLRLNQQSCADNTGQLSPALTALLRNRQALEALSRRDFRLTGLADSPAIGFVRSTIFREAVADPTRLTRLLSQRPELGPQLEALAEQLSSEGWEEPREIERTPGLAQQQAQMFANAQAIQAHNAQSGRPNRPGQSRAGRVITGDQLSAALAGAERRSTMPVSSAQLDRALAAALPSATKYSAQLEQLHLMGIHDDQLSIHALDATGGDLQSALEILYTK